MLWLSGGRPEAVAGFYRVRFEGRPTEAHEFHSLAPVPLTTTRGGRTVSAPRVRGVTPRPLPGAPRPALTPTERLRQMRALAREFKAAVDLEKGGSDLRLLSQPVFRYESKADGALFAFVLTTDPEVLLMIEDRPDKGVPAWHYANARMSNRSLVAKHRDRVVWECRPTRTTATRPSRIVSDGTSAPADSPHVPLCRPGIHGARGHSSLLVFGNTIGPRAFQGLSPSFPGGYAMDEQPRQLGIADGMILIAGVATGFGRIQLAYPDLTPAGVWGLMRTPKVGWSPEAAVTA